MSAWKAGLMAVLVAMTAISGCKKKESTSSTTEVVQQDQLLLEDNQRLRTEKADLEQQLLQLQSLLNDRNTELTDWKTKYGQAESRMMGQEAEMSKMRTSHTGSNGDLGALQNRVKELEGILAKRDSDGNLVLVLDSKVFFKSGSAELNESTRSSLLQVSAILNENYRSNKISIDGHADSDPIKKSSFKTNWELSSARSLSVLHFLNQQGKVAEERLSCRAFSYFAPVAPNDSSSNKAKNRRVEIVIING